MRNWVQSLLAFPARLGRGVFSCDRTFEAAPRAFLAHTSGIAALFSQALWYVFVAPWKGKGKMRPQLVPMLYNVGVRTFPVVFAVSFLIGAIMVVQTGPILEKWGQTGLIPESVALSICRVFGPIMTAIIVTARVGASFTAVLASMKINEEVLALQTMAINPVGFLVAPRLLAMVIMVPCLTVLADAIGIGGGALVANQLFDISFSEFVNGAAAGLHLSDMVSGILKAVVNAVLICMICCYYGLITEGGPISLGRNTMVAVVTSLVAVIIGEGLMGAAFVNWVYQI